MLNDTICAISTALKEGAISIVRMSGDESFEIIRKISDVKTIKPNTIVYSHIRDEGEIIDEVLISFFAAGKSYTLEDMVEINCHGGIYVTRLILNLLLKNGCRLAEAGEFTKRAFLNGKMDLTQAEAVMDIINAQADASLRSALHQLSGGIRRQVEAIEDLVLDARSSVEAAIDYPDETEEEVYADLPQKINESVTRINQMLDTAKQGRYLREGIRVVILGKPNVGKSSLFNRLLGEERAIVTDIAGTTRDLLDEHVAWDGVSVHLMDTAGLREAADRAEQIGIDRAKNALQYADLLLLILDGAGGISEEDQKLLRETEGYPRLILSNKCDIDIVPSDLAVSCVTGEGIEALKARILSLVGQEINTTGITNLRHIRALERAKSSLVSALQQTEPDCIATDLREASHHLGSITGTDVDEKLLDRIFENFCVGK